MNETIRRFGYPATLIEEHAHWVVLLRPAQPTLGSLVLAAKGEARAFGELAPEAFAELHRAIRRIEEGLGRAVAYEKINYLMLMMVDPHVHFHVIPRYEGSRGFAGFAIEDRGWPGAPDLAQAMSLDDAEVAAFRDFLLRSWPSDG